MVGMLDPSWLEHIGEERIEGAFERFGIVGQLAVPIGPVVDDRRLGAGRAAFGDEEIVVADPRIAGMRPIAEQDRAFRRLRQRRAGKNV